MHEGAGGGLKQITNRSSGRAAELNVSNMAELKRHWMFYAEDENGDGHYLQDWYFTGTYEEASHYANARADEWEEQVGGWILKLVIESHGIANQSVQPTL